jgi:hypothetical protein
MKNNAGLIAVITALVAFVGISTLPRGSSDAAGTQGSRKTAKGAASNKKNTEVGAPPISAACADIARRLRVFIYPKDFTDIGAETCFPKGATFPGTVRFVIAAAPNPISTHLALMFDRSIETIQQAAEDESYSYDSSWFPWDDLSKDYSSVDDQHAAEDEQEIKEHQPGIMVFRGPVQDKSSPYESGLVVFIVSESPTAGVDRTQFQNALALVKNSGGLDNGTRLNVLGPMFSGSLPSLDQVLAVVPKVAVFSGSVSSQSSARWFAARLEKRGSTFRTAMGADQDMVESFLKYLEAEHYGRGCVAIISEDETAFGNDQKDDTGKSHPDEGRCDLFGQNPKPIYVYYPRDIASLRSAYERQSIFNTKKGTSDKSSSSTMLRSDLAEPENSNHDTVRSYAGQLTPLAQEAVLQNISKVLKEKAIQFIVVRSTNSLDQVFLSQFFRRANPEARVVLDGSDLLFKRGVEGASLRGVMVLSPYPLLAPWQQDWTVALRHPKNDSYRVFGEDVAEGLYVAARELFRRDDPQGASTNASQALALPQGGKGEPVSSTQSGPGVPVNDYGPPSWPGLNSPNQNWQRPGSWLSVIGHRQFWPMAFLNSNDPTMPAPTELRRDLPLPGDETVHPPFRFNIELILLFALGLAWSACHLSWCWRGSVVPTSAFRLTYFTPLERVQHSGLIAFGTLLPAVLAIVTAGAGGFFAFDIGRRVVFGLWFIAMIAMCSLACIRNFSLPVSFATTASVKVKKWHWISALSAVGVLVGLVALQLLFIRFLKPRSAIPTYWRAIHLTNGVSPLTPEILLLVGLYLWFWYSLRGLALFGDDRPVLPADENLPKMFRIFGWTQAQERVEDNAVPAGKKYFRNFGIVLPLTLIAFVMALESIALRTLGERAFGILMLIWFALCVSLILADIVQLWTTWRRLLELLRHLDRLPLRRTLASLRGLTWSSVWAMSSNVLEDRYCLISRQLESLTHLANVIRQSKELSTATKRDVLRKIVLCRSKARDFAEWYINILLKENSGKGYRPERLEITSLKVLQEDLAATSAYILMNILVPTWRRETQSLLFDRSGSSSESQSASSDDGNKPDGGSDVAETKQSVPQHVLAAEEFVVLPYVGFIQNTLGRVRTIVLGSLCLFIAATLAASSYPFDPLPVLGGIFLTVFAIAGGVSMFVFAQMHRDATLSHITHTAPGQLGGQFWLHLVTFGIGPLLGLLTTLFPSITDFVSSWLQPSMQALQ